MRERERMVRRIEYAEYWRKEEWSSLFIRYISVSSE